MCHDGSLLQFLFSVGLDNLFHPHVPVPVMPYVLYMFPYYKKGPDCSSVRLFCSGGGDLNGSRVWGGPINVMEIMLGVWRSDRRVIF